jgi:excisionase family DNA binding protein
MDGTPEKSSNPSLADLWQLASDIRTEVQSLIAEQRKPTISWPEDEAADILGVSKVTIQRLRREGKIGYTAVAGRARYTRKNLEDYLERNAMRAAVG